MIATGYLLQTTTWEALQPVLVIVHLLTSGVFLGGYLVHLVLARRVARS